MAFKVDWRYYSLLLILVQYGETTYSIFPQLRSYSHHTGNKGNANNLVNMENTINNMDSMVYAYTDNDKDDSDNGNNRRSNNINQIGHSGQGWENKDTDNGATHIQIYYQKQPDFKLKQFILDIVMKNYLNKMSPDLSLYIQHPNLEKLISDIFQKNNIPQTKINPQMLTLLLRIIRAHITNARFPEIPLSLIPFIVNLKEADNLSYKVLDWVYENRKRLNLVDIFIKIVKANKDKYVPHVLRHWIFKLENGKEILGFLNPQGKKECFPKFNQNFKCVNTLKSGYGRIECNQALHTGIINCVILKTDPVESTNTIPHDISLELLTFIQSLNNGRLLNISLKLLQFILHSPDLHSIIRDIFQKNNITIKKVNPQIVTLLLQLIKDTKTNTPIGDICQSLIIFVLNLKGGDDLGRKILDWEYKNKQPHIMDLILQTIKANGGKNIPIILRNWILSLPNSKDILEFIEKPGEIKCTEESAGHFKCFKTIILEETLDLQTSDIKLELLTFIQNLSNGQLVEISPNLLQFLLNNPDVYSLILDIFQKNNIPTTNVNPQTVSLLLDFIKDNETSKPIRDIPQSLLELLLKLRGAENLSQIALDWISENKQPDMMSMFLQIIKKNGERNIPLELRKWILSLPNGKEILEFIKKPGEIKCTEKSVGHFKCVKKVILEETPDLHADIKFELLTFIQNLSNGQLVEISPNLLQFLLHNPDVHSLLLDIFQKNNIPTTNVNPQTVSLLLNFIKDNETSKPIRDIPQSLLELLLKLRGAENLSQIALDWISENKQTDMMSMFLQIIKKNGERNIPLELRKWILSLPNGKEILEFIKKPGEIKCTEESVGHFKCVKKIILEETPDLHADIKFELLTFIQNLSNGQLVEISPNLLQFLLHNPDVHSLLLDIFQKNNIPTTNVNPQTVSLLLNFIKDNETSKPIRDIPQSLLELLLKLRGAENLSQIALDWISENKQTDMMSMFLQIIKKNGERNIPLELRKWILSLPNGKEILEFIKKPGEIKCTEESVGHFKCVKKNILEETPDLHADIKFELLTFIQNLSNGQLVEISPNLLQFLLHNPDVHSLLLDIFQKNNIPTTNVNPQTVSLLLNFIKDNETSKPIRDIPQSLLELLLKLRGAENLSQIALDWISENKQPDMMSMFLQIIKKNGERNIPLELRKWILSLPNGKEILEFIEKPGEIKCTEESVGHFKCVKKIILEETPDLHTDIKFELLTFIQNLSNEQLVEISPNLLQFLLNNPDVHSLLLDIFQKNNIPTTNVNPQTVSLLLNFIKDNQTNKPIRDIPQSLLELLLTLRGAENLSQIALDWISENKQPDMMSMFLQIIKKKGERNIPIELRKWILSLPNGKEILEFIEKPGEIKCTEESVGHFKCIKKIILEKTPEWNTGDVKLELLTFIQNLSNGQLVEISPNLLQFLLNNPDVYSLILNIFQKNNIPTTNVNPQTVLLLLDFIKDNQTNKPIRDIPQSLLELVLKLRGAENLSQLALDWISENKQPDMMSMFLQIIQKNGERNIPLELHKWILSLPNSKDILEFIENPGEIKCTQESVGQFKCVKKIIFEETPEWNTGDIKLELLTFIQNLFNGQLVEISPNLLQFLLNNPDVHSLLFDIFQNNNIPTTIVNPQTVSLLLDFIKDIQTNKPLRDIPQSLLELLLKLRGAENLSQLALDWISENKQPDIVMSMFLQIIKENGGRNIPLALRKWILSLPNSKDFLEFIEKPGEIKCTEESIGKVVCVKSVII